jgi:hypothetical protein
MSGKSFEDEEHRRKTVNFSPFGNIVSTINAKAPLFLGIETLSCF